MKTKEEYSPYWDAILFCHKSFVDTKHFTEWKELSSSESKKAYIAEITKSALVKYADDLNKMLGNTTLLFLFDDAYLVDVLSKFSSGSNEDDVLKELESELKFLQESIEYAESKLPSKKIRILSIFDILQIFDKLDSHKDLFDYMLGNGAEARYDTPKFVESFIRLRHMGSHIPIFRLDQDVLFPYPNEKYPGTELALAIWEMKKHVKDHHRATSVLSTILSADYIQPTPANNNYEAYVCGRATRLLPALTIPTKSEINKYTDKAGESRAKLMLENCFDLKTVNYFFKHLWKWGAPHHAVISGAFLYMSDTVVLDIPPFSNLSQQVMWIDDHLRFALHRESGHFCKDTVRDVDTLKPLNVKATNIEVMKHRTFDEFTYYTVCKYIPTIIYGSIVDYWICEEPLLKRKRSELSPKEILIWESARKNGAPGILSRTIKACKAGKSFIERELHKELDNAMLKALNIIRDEWAKDEYKDTIMGLWVRGDLASRLSFLPPPENEDNARKLQDFLVKNPQFPAENDTSGDFYNSLRQLRNDITAYCHWVEKWPNFVSIIRAKGRGKVKCDIEWSGVEIKVVN